MPSLTFGRVLRESSPIALILLIWGVVAQFFPDRPLSAVWLAGLVTAALYAIVRGHALASNAEPIFETNDPRSAVRTTVRLLLPSLVWFGLALVFDFSLGLFEPTEEIRDLAVTVLQGTGLVTVLLFAVAAGTASIRHDGRPRSLADD